MNQKQIDNYRLVKLAMNRHQKACEKGFRLVNLDIDIFNSLVDNAIVYHVVKIESKSFGDDTLKEVSYTYIDDNYKVIDFVEGV